MRYSWLGALIATGLSLLALFLTTWGVDDRIRREYPIASWFVDLIPAISVVILIAVLVLILTYVVFYIWFLFDTRTSISTLQNVTSATCREEDLPAIMKIAQDEIGPVTNYEDTLALYRRNKHSFRKIINTETHEIIGYFCVMPLTTTGLERVKERNLLAPPIDTGCFASRFYKGADAYIGAIAGVGKKGKYGAYEQLRLFILNKQIITAYARPMTDRGVELAKENGFKPIAETDTLAKGVYAFRIREI